VRGLASQPQPIGLHIPVTEGKKHEKTLIILCMFVVN